MKDEIDLNDIFKGLPALIPRRKLYQIFGMNPRTLSNLDAAGKGPPKTHIGRLVFYEKNSFKSWLEKRAKL